MMGERSIVSKNVLRRQIEDDAVAMTVKTWRLGELWERGAWDPWTFSMRLLGMRQSH